jgi:hypothetical protein
MTKKFQNGWLCVVNLERLIIQKNSITRRLQNFGSHIDRWQLGQLKPWKGEVVYKIGQRKRVTPWSWNKMYLVKSI